MSSAYYISVENAPEDLDYFVNGKAVSQYARFLGEAAKELGTRSVDEFVSQDPEEAAEFIADHGGDPDEIELPEEVWYDAQVGVEWTEAMLGCLDGKESDYQNLIDDLNEYKELFYQLKEAGLRWHFSVDF